MPKSIILLLLLFISILSGKHASNTILNISVKMDYNKIIYTITSTLGQKTDIKFVIQDHGEHRYIVKMNPFRALELRGGKYVDAIGISAKKDGDKLRIELDREKIKVTDDQRLIAIPLVNGNENYNDRLDIDYVAEAIAENPDQEALQPIAPVSPSLASKKVLSMKKSTGWINYYFEKHPHFTPDKIYTVSFDMETSGGDSELVVEFVNSEITSFRNSRPNTRERKFFIGYPTNPMKNIRYHLAFRMDKTTSSSTTVKISNIKVQEGLLDFPNHKTRVRKKSGYTTVDKFATWRQGGKVIFPINLYFKNNLVKKGKRSWKQYRKQGITGVLNPHIDELEAAVRAGLTTNAFHFSGEIKNGFENYHQRWFKELKYFKTRHPNTWKGVLEFSFDNEFYIKGSYYAQAIQKFKNIDSNMPIQMLNGHYGGASWYNNSVDITGTYIANDSDALHHKEALTQIHNLFSMKLDESLKIPVGLMQINQGTGKNFGSIMISGIGYGATMMEYWVDNPYASKEYKRELDITKNPEWKQLPYVRKYIDKMVKLGIIGSNPFTNFKIEQRNSRFEFMRGRVSLSGKAYIFASNMYPTSREKTIHFSQLYSGLKYVPSGELIDIVTGKKRGSIENGKISLTLAAHKWAVLEVVSKE